MNSWRIPPPPHTHNCNPLLLSSAVITGMPWGVYAYVEPAHSYRGVGGAMPFQKEDMTPLWIICSLKTLTTP